MGNEIKYSHPRLISLITFIKFYSLDAQNIAAEKKPNLIKKLSFSPALDKAMQTQTTTQIKEIIVTIIMNNLDCFCFDSEYIKNALFQSITVGYLLPQEINTPSGTLKDTIYFTEMVQISRKDGALGRRVREKMNIFYMETLDNIPTSRPIAHREGIDKVFSVHLETVFYQLSMYIGLKVDRYLDDHLKARFVSNKYFSFFWKIYGLSFHRNVIYYSQPEVIKRGEILTLEGNLIDLQKDEKIDFFYFGISGSAVFSKRIMKFQKIMNVFESSPGEVLQVTHYISVISLAV